MPAMSKATRAKSTALVSPYQCHRGRGRVWSADHQRSDQGRSGTGRSGTGRSGTGRSGTGTDVALVLKSVGRRFYHTAQNTALEPTTLVRVGGFVGLAAAIESAQIADQSVSFWQWIIRSLSDSRCSAAGHCEAMSFRWSRWLGRLVACLRSDSLRELLRNLLSYLPSRLSRI